jgi:hypothetical protein
MVCLRKYKIYSTANLTEVIAMRTSLNLSIDSDTYKLVEEMKKKGIKPSHFFKKAVKVYADNDFDLPITIKKPEPVL